MITAQNIISSLIAVFGVILAFYLSKLLHRSEGLFIHVATTCVYNSLISALNALLSPKFVFHANNFLLLTNDQDLVTTITIARIFSIFITSLLGAKLSLHTVKVLEHYRILKINNGNVSLRWRFLWAVPILVFLLLGACSSKLQVEIKSNITNSVAIGIKNGNFTHYSTLLVVLSFNVVVSLYVFWKVWALLRDMPIDSYRKRVNHAFTQAAIVEALFFTCILYIPLTIAVSLLLVGFECQWLENSLTDMYYILPLLEQAASTAVLNLNSNLPSASSVRPSGNVYCNSVTVSAEQFEMQDRN